MNRFLNFLGYGAFLTLASVIVMGIVNPDFFAADASMSPTKSTQATYQVAYPYIQATDGHVQYITQPGDNWGQWGIADGDVTRWKQLVAANSVLKNPDLIYPGHTVLNIPDTPEWNNWLYQKFPPTTTTVIDTPQESTNPGRRFPGFLAGILTAGALVGMTVLGKEQRKRILRPSDEHPMRTTGLQSAEEAAEEIRQQVIALSRIEPGNPDALANPSEWTIVSATRGLGNGAVESHFSNGSTRKENFHNEPCYEVTARNTSGEERKFYIRIKCANQLTGLTGQFMLDDFTFTPGGDAVELNMPFVPAADPTPATADSTPAAASTESAPAPTDEVAPTQATPAPVETEADPDLVEIKALGEGRFRITRSGQVIEVTCDHVQVKTGEGVEIFRNGRVSAILLPAAKAADTTSQA